MRRSTPAGSGISMKLPLKVHGVVGAAVVIGDRLEPDVDAIAPVAPRHQFPTARHVGSVDIHARDAEVLCSHQVGIGEQGGTRADADVEQPAPTEAARARPDTTRPSCRRWRVS